MAEAANTGPNRTLPAADYFWERKRRMVLDLIAAHTPSLEPKSTPLVFVDLGCGDGTDLAMVAGFLQRIGASGEPIKQKWKCIGVDGFPRFLEQCKALLASRGLTDVEVVTANIFKPLKFTDSSVDVLYCSEVLEHIPDPGSFVQEIHRVLTAGGLALITTPNEPNILQRSWWSRARREEIQRRLRGRVNHPSVEINGELVDLYDHISLHTNRKLDQLMNDSGFKVIDFRRGAMFYGGQPWLSAAPIHAARLGIEATLDLMPRFLVRNISDQIIGLYRKTN